MPWRKSITWLVLITFSSSILSPVFASTRLPLHNNGSKTKQTTNLKVKDGAKGLKKPQLKAIQKSEDNSRQFKNLRDQSPSFDNKYLPYFELGGVKCFNQESRIAGIYDLFIPLFQNDNQLLFADFRVFDRSGSSAEGNLHLGYRKLYPNSKQMFGIYGAYDYKRSSYRNSFSQVTLGVEYWHDKLFVGGNVYKPIGSTKKLAIEETSNDQTTGRSIFSTKHYERALGGIDGELGYSFTDSLTGYAGGYYFHASDAGTVAGPKARITYDYQKNHGKILGILDGISIELGAQHDKPRGNTAYVGVKFKVGFGNGARTSNLSGFERHMTELVRRDPDVVVGNVKPHKIELSSKQGHFYSKDEEEDFSQSTTEELLKEFDLQEMPRTQAELNRRFNRKLNISEDGEQQRRYTGIFKVLKQRLSFAGNKNQNKQKRASSDVKQIGLPLLLKFSGDGQDFPVVLTGSNDSAELPLSISSNQKIVYDQLVNLFDAGLTFDEKTGTDLSSILLNSDGARLDLYEKNLSFTPLLNSSDWNYNNISKNYSLADLNILKNVNTDYEYEDQDIGALVLLRAREKGLDFNAVSLMPRIGDMQTELPRQLLDASYEYKKLVSEGQEPFARKVLFPINLYGSHWVSLILYFTQQDRLETIQYIDPSGSCCPSELESILKGIYGKDIAIDCWSGLAQTDAKSCGPLLVENIIQALQNSSLSVFATDRLVREVRVEHINLLEQFEPDLQFYFRQNHDLHSFEFLTSDQAVIEGFYPVELADSLRGIAGLPDLRVSLYGGGFFDKLASDLKKFFSGSGSRQSTTQDIQVLYDANDGLAESFLGTELKSMSAAPPPPTRSVLEVVASDIGSEAAHSSIGDGGESVASSLVGYIEAATGLNDDIEFSPPPVYRGRRPAAKVRGFLTLLEPDDSSEPIMSLPQQTERTEYIATNAKVDNMGFFGIIKSTLGYSSAAILCGIFGSATNFLYGFLIALISEDALTASGLIVTLRNILNMQTFIVQPAAFLITQKRNTPEKYEVGRLYRHTLKISIATSIPAMILSNFIGPILKLLGQDHDISDIVQDYFRAYSIAIPFAFLTSNNMQLAFGMGKKLAGTLINFYMFISTIGFGYIAIYLVDVGDKIFALGLSTALAFLTTFLGTTFYFWTNTRRGGEFADYKLFSHHRGIGYTTNSLTIVRKGLLVLIGNGVSMVSDAIDMQIAGVLGKVALQAAGVAVQYGNIISFIAISTAQLNGILVEKLIARNMLRNAFFSSYIITTTSIIMPILLSVSYIFAADYLIAVFKVKDEAVIAMTKKLFYFIGALQTINAIKYTLIGSFRGARDFVTPAGVIIVSSIFIRIPLSFVFGLRSLLDFSVYGLIGACIAATLFASFDLSIRWSMVSLITLVKQKVPAPPSNLISYFLSPIWKPISFAKYVTCGIWGLFKHKQRAVH